jgi:hypothetical protein
MAIGNKGGADEESSGRYIFLAQKRIIPIYCKPTLKEKICLNMVL